MEPLPKLTEAMVRQIAGVQSFERGRDYHEQGAVLTLTRRGNRLYAEVEGSQYEPYQVTITLDAGGIVDADCTCPYDWGGCCKHIVATLLACIHGPEQIEERPDVETLLSRLDRDQLQVLLLTLIERQPALTDFIKGKVVALHAQPSDAIPSPRQRHTPLDPTPVHRQVHAILHSLDRMRPSEAYWHVGSVTNDLRQVLDQARTFIEAGDGHNALVILEAMTEEYIADWTYLDDSDGEASSFFEDLKQPWAEALLSADLTPAERKRWADRLTHWQGELDDYGLDETFDAAQAAAILGWDHPPLQRVLQGEVVEEDAWENEAPWYADDLATARLNVLARQGRYQEYLCLAEAEGQFERYVTMLVQLGRIQEAVDYGLRHLATTSEALALAKALREQGEIEEALRIAEHGLSLEGTRASLARWLRDVASGASQSERALHAAVVAFRESPSLADYQAVQALAGARWPELRTELLNYLRQTSSYYPQAQVEILLDEELIEDAIKAVEAAGEPYALVEPVVDAALHSHPDWAIHACRRQAEPIMNQGKSKYYHAAVRWLEKARAAYLAAGRQAEWEDYLDTLLTQHNRKYSLVPMLKRLR
jgi:uncharacterized Zn finger protein